MPRSIKLLVRYSCTLCYSDMMLQVPADHTAIVGNPKAKGVWIPPAPDALIRGDVQRWAHEAGISSERIPGYWLDGPGSDTPADATAAPGEKVFLFLHGGAYMTLSAHPADTSAQIPRGLLAHTTTVRRALSLEYRLARDGTHTFPAQLLDVVAAYAHLVQRCGFAPRDVVLVGDSAGGNLALALARYVLEQPGAGLAPPGAIVLCSPWTDIAVQTYARDSSAYTNMHVDYVDLTARDSIDATSGFLGRFAGADSEAIRYTAPASRALEDERRASFVGFPRTIIVCAGGETLRDQIHALHAKMEADVGEKGVEFVEYEDAVHDFLMFPWHEPERTQALRRIGEWIDG